MTSPDGETWSPPVPVGENGEWLTGVRARGAGFAALGLSGGLYYSDETASQWNLRPMNDSWLSAVTFLPSDPSVGYLSGAGKWWRTEDAGGTWESHTPPGYFFGDFAFQDPQHGVAVEGDLVPSIGIVWRTTNGGGFWQKADQQIAGLRAVASDGSGRLWAAGDRGLLVVSSDGGANWALVDRVWDVPGLVADYAGFDFAGSAGFLVGSHGTIRRFQAGNPVASTWSRRRLGEYELHGVFARDARNAFACGYLTHSDIGVVLATHDGGETWTVVVKSPGVFWYGIAGTRT